MIGLIILYHSKYSIDLFKSRVGELISIRRRALGGFVGPRDNSLNSPKRTGLGAYSTNRRVWTDIVVG
jgi:hypothetical protein